MRVCYKWLGRKKFRNGIQIFLKKFQFQTFTAAELWEILDGVSGEPVGRVMDALAKSAGFPILKVNLLQWEDNAILFEIAKVRLTSKI